MEKREKKEMTLKEWLESVQYDFAKRMLFKEINSTVVNRNTKEYRERYKKTPEEKAQVFNLREQWKNNQRLFQA